MKSWRKLATILLAGAMATSMLAGCGSDTTTSGDSTASNGSGENTESTAVIKWYIPGDKSPQHQEVMEQTNALLKEKVNATLDLQVISEGEYNDKMKLVTTSQEDYDIMFTCSWLNSFTENMSRKAFRELDDVYEKYGKDIQEQVPSWLIDAGRVNGKLYAIPNQQIIAGQQGLVVQKEYADKYGLTDDPVDSIRDLEPFLQKLADNEKGMIPIEFVQRITQKDYEAVVGEYVYLKKGDDSLELLPFYEVCKEDYELRNEYYKKGMIREDIATLKDNSGYTKAQKIICSYNTYKPGLETEQESIAGVPYIAIPVGEAYVTAAAGTETMNAMNINCKNPEAAMKVWNAVYADKEVYNSILFGIEGTNFKKTGDETVELLDGNNHTYCNKAWEIGNQFNAWCMPGQSPETWEETDKMNREAEISPIRGFSFDPTPVQAQMAQVAAVQSEFERAEYVTDDVDGLIEQITEKYKAAGLDEIVAEAQKQLNAWVEENSK